MENPLLTYIKTFTEVVSMLKLTKYEFRKSRTTLIIMGLIFALLEGYFIFGIITKDVMHTGSSTFMLSLFSMCCYFIVYIMAITAYSKELSSKSSYLIFMTPNSSLSIILSKMLNILIIGAVMVLVITGFAMLDVHLFLNTYDSGKSFLDFMGSFLASMGINTALILPTIIAYLLEFLINFFAVITMIYFAITLSSTVLQNNKFKGFLSFALVVLFIFLMGKVTEIIPNIYERPSDAFELVINLLPTTAFELVVMICAIFGSATLLDKKVSL